MYMYHEQIVSDQTVDCLLLMNPDEVLYSVRPCSHLMKKNACVELFPDLLKKPSYSVMVLNYGEIPCE